MVSKVGSAGMVVDSVIASHTSQSMETKGNVSSTNSSATRPIERPSERAAQLQKVNQNNVQSGNNNKEAAKTTIIPGSKPRANEIKNVSKELEGEVVVKKQQNEQNKYEAIYLRPEAVEIAVEDVNSILAPVRAHVHFSFHEKTKRYSFRVYDVETGETIREVPPKESLDMVAKLFEMAGILVDKKL